MKKDIPAPAKKEAAPAKADDPAAAAAGDKPAEDTKMDDPAAQPEEAKQEAPQIEYEIKKKNKKTTTSINFET